MEQEKLLLPGVNLWETKEEKVKAAQDKLTSTSKGLSSKDFQPDGAKDPSSKYFQRDGANDPSRDDVQPDTSKGAMPVPAKHLRRRNLKPDGAKYQGRKDLQSDTGKDGRRKDPQADGAKDPRRKDQQSDTAKDPRHKDLQTGEAIDMKPGVAKYPSSKGRRRKDLKPDAVLQSGIVGVKALKGEGLEEVSKDDAMETILEEPETDETKPDTEPETKPDTEPETKPGKPKKLPKEKDAKIASLKPKLDQITTMLSVKTKLLKLLKEEEEMEMLQKHMANWLTIHKERALRVFKTVHEDDCLTYQQFFSAMIDLDSPFKFVEIYALAIRLSDQKPGLIAIDDIMKSIEKREDPTVCEICGLGKPPLLGNYESKSKVPDNTQPIAKSAAQVVEDKPVHLFTEFLITKKGDEKGDTGDGKSQSDTNPTGKILFASGTLETQLKSMRQKNLMVKWTKKQEIPKFGKQASSLRGSRMKKGSSKLMLVKRGTGGHSKRLQSARSDLAKLVPSKSQILDKPKFGNRSTRNLMAPPKTRLKNIFTKAVNKVDNNARVRKIFNMLTEGAKNEGESTNSKKNEIEEIIANRIAKPLVRYVLVKMRSIVHDKILSCTAHFTKLLTNEAPLSYLVHCIKEINDVSCSQVYISPNRLRLSQSLLPLDSVLKQCGYRGYCKAHPQKVTLYYDFDIPENPSFIKSQDLIDIYNEERKGSLSGGSRL